MKTTPIIIVLAALLTMSVGCDDDDPIKAFDTVEQMSQGVCDLAFRCCTPGEASYMLGPFVNAEECAERLMNRAQRSSWSEVQLDLLVDAGVAVPNVGALDVAIEGLRTEVDAEELTRCLEHLSMHACNEAPSTDASDEGCVAPAPPSDELAPCHPNALFVGKGTKGDSCSSDGLLGTSYECAPGFVCIANNSTGVDGQCFPTGLEGELCYSDYECANGLYCSLADGTCQTYREEGQPCVYYDREDLNPDPATALILCRPDLSCDPIAKVCVAQCQRGAACGGDWQCDEEQELRCISGRCDRPRDQGLPCVMDEDCQETLRCEESLEEPGSFYCVERLADGEACMDARDCENDFCNFADFLCAPRVAPGGLCRTNTDDECEGGICENEMTACADDTECPRSGACDPDTFMCVSVCVAQLPDGAACTSDRECESEACVAGYCRSLPLASGQECDSDYQCESEFCSRDWEDRRCLDLPLALGEACDASYQCSSGVCFDSDHDGNPMCVLGLGEGEPCFDPDQPPCNPDKLYCDPEVDPPICTVLKETGTLCTSDVECRGWCELRYGRMLCSPAAAAGTAVCGGGGTTPSE